MKTLLVTFIFFFLSFIFFPTCVEDNNIVSTEEKSLNKDLNLSAENIDGSQPQWPAVIYDSTYGEIIMDYSIIDTTIQGREPCGVKVLFGWAIDHFQQKNGKYLGVCGNGQKSFYDLYHKYGFTNLFITNSVAKQDAINAGFKVDSLMGAINISPGSVTQLGYLGYYHLDEPLENGHSLSQVLALSTFINTYFHNSKLMLSSYSIINGPYLSLVSRPNTYLMCDQYYDGTIYYGNDQRGYWTSYKSYYLPENVFTHWISARIDGEQGDFPMLFGHANNLGINTLWLFEADCNNNSAIVNFCNEGWRSGWLRLFQRRIQMIFHCDGCPIGCNPSNPEGWYLAYSFPTGTVREVFP